MNFDCLIIVLAGLEREEFKTLLVVFGLTERVKGSAGGKKKEEKDIGGTRDGR